MSDARTVTGHTIVMVKLADGGEVVVRKGQSLPDGLADGELERLERVGAFGEPRQADLVAQGARRLDAGHLTPQMTLAANPEPGDGPLLADERVLFSDAEKAEAERLAAEKAAANVNPKAPAAPVVVAPPAPPAPAPPAPKAPPAPPK